MTRPLLDQGDERARPPAPSPAPEALSSSDLQTRPAAADQLARELPRWDLVPPQGIVARRRRTA